jgi:hypothetical protein
MWRVRGCSAGHSGSGKFFCAETRTIGDFFKAWRAKGTAMINPLVLKEFTIGVTHTISTGVPYENIKVEARITCGVKIGGTDEEFAETLKLAEEKLKHLAMETYKAQLRRPKQAQQTQAA